MQPLQMQEPTPAVMVAATSSRVESQWEEVMGYDQALAATKT